MNDERFGNGLIDWFGPSRNRGDKTTVKELRERSKAYMDELSPLYAKFLKTDAGKKLTPALLNKHRRMFNLLKMTNRISDKLAKRMRKKKL